MDLQTVEKKLKREVYSSDEEFEKDIMLIWNNALFFNEEGTDVHFFAQEMKKEFERLLSLPQDLLFVKKQPKGEEYGTAKGKVGSEKPVSPQEL